MKFSDFNQVVEYLEKFINLEKRTDMYNCRTYRLDRMRSILERIGNPQNCYNTIHVAGSKGKGSTAAFIAKGLEACGYKTGLYMSPHVMDYRERFTLCTRFFTEEELVNTGNHLCEMLESFEPEPTAFEMYTAFAFLLFKETNCSWAVIETGLGGRLDATNVILPKACVLTPIELEHTDLLGDTIEKIAIEKSKIIKPNTPSFSALQKEDAMHVFEAEAKEQNSKLTKLSDQIIKLETVSEKDGQLVHIELKDGYNKDLKLKMIGQVQAQNCTLALTVLRTLGLYKEGKTESSLEELTLWGRMEKIEFDRDLFIDGAHTEMSVKNLLNSFNQMYPNNNGVCIFGAVNGKNHSAMSSLILENFNKIVISKPGTFKKNDPKALYELVCSMKKNQTVVLLEKASDALRWAKENTKPEDPVLCCGSFYLAGEIKEALCL